VFTVNEEDIALRVLPELERNNIGVYHCHPVVLYV
jgi:hypothetical protein